MNKELVTRILIQLEPSLAQEFGLAIAEDEKKLKALEIFVKKKPSIQVIWHLKNYIEYKTYVTIVQILEENQLTQEEFDLLKEVLL